MHHIKIYLLSLMHERHLMDTNPRKLKSAFLALSLFGSFVWVFPSPSFAEKKLYACYEEESVGFVIAEGMKQVNFKLERFTLEHDTKAKTLFSEKAGVYGNLPPLSRCDVGLAPVLISCFKSGGGSFAFNSSSMSFVRTEVNASWPNEGAEKISRYNSISYGKCERF